MTVLSLSSSVRKVLSTDPDILSISSSAMKSSELPRPLPRISIRKRPHTSSAPRESIPCVTSAFLSNLFADAEKARPTEEPRTKKHCLPKTKSHKSFGVENPGSVSPITAVTSYFQEQAKNTQEKGKGIAIGTDTTSATDALLFPSLPAAVSESSYSTHSLTTVILDQLSSNTDNANGKESYGWFVETDHDVKSSFTHEESIYGSLLPSPAQDLAFCPYSAPTKSSLDAEVEWAKAADTVDDVLGDFF